MRLLSTLVLAVALLLAAGRAAADCPAGDLARGASVRGSQARGTIVAIVGEVDGTAELEGAAWVEIDLGEPRTIQALLVQAETPDGMVLSGSADGDRWGRIADLAPAPGAGMQVLAARSPGGARVRFLRLALPQAVGRARVARVGAWCRVPDVWPPTAADAGVGIRRFITPGGVTRLKLLLAAVGGLLLTAGLVLDRSGRPGPWRRTREVALAGVALAAALGWWNFGAFHFGSYLHVWEHYHYYLGAKYFSELGHDGLYPCTTVADLDAGLDAAVGQRKLREARTNQLAPALEVVGDPASCRDRFTSERWTAFTRDVAFFRGAVAAPAWEAIFRDHGYNATPLWSATGGLLTRFVPASTGGMLFLGLLDLPLLLLMWGVVWWTFGWRATAVAVLWWGTNDLAGFGWTGGAFLRQDWLALTVIGICLVHRGLPSVGGAALTWATLLRVFPGYAVSALVLQAAARIVRERRWVLGRTRTRFAVGSVAALVALGLFSLAAPGGGAAWSRFAENSRNSLRSTGPNIVGLMTVLSYEHENRMELLQDPSLQNPQENWLTQKRRVFAERRWVFWVLLGAYLVLLERALRGRSASFALRLGIALIPVASFLSCYYYSVLLGLGLLRGRRGTWVGVGLCGLAVLTQLTGYWLSGPIRFDQRFALNSLGVVVLAVGATALYAFSGERRETVAAGR